MSEKEIRSVLQDVCAELDRRVREAMRQGVRMMLLPAALGAGLALSVGCGTDGDSPIDGRATTDQGGNKSDLGPQPAYIAPAPDGGHVVPPYSAPEYMAPDPS